MGKHSLVGLTATRDRVTPRMSTPSTEADIAINPVGDFWLARGAALLVLGSAIANGLGALALPQASLAYKPGQLDAWLSVNLAHPNGAEWGAIFFTAGVLMMVPVAFALDKLLGGRRRGLARIGAMSMVVAALTNGMATMLPFVVSTQLAPLVDVANPPAVIIATAMLGAALTADAAAIGFLGVGILLVGVAMMSDANYGRALGVLGIIAGLAVMPMILEASYDWAAHWVLWGSLPLLVWLLGLAWRLWHLPGNPAQAPS